MASTLSEKISSELRAELARQRLSQAEVALAMGRSQAYLSRRLSGDIPFDVDDLAQLAEILGVPVAALLGALADAA